MFSEMKILTNMLCELTNVVLSEVTKTEKCEELPLFICLTADTCYVMYDAQEESIIKINLRMFNNMGIIVEVDPIECSITGTVAGEKTGVLQMDRQVANILFACIQQAWNLRKSADCLFIISEDDRYIAADLI